VGEFKHISTERADGRVKIYHFEDQDGIIFSVTAGVTGNDLGLPTADTPVCDYMMAFIDTEKEAVMVALQSGFPVKWFDTTKILHVPGRYEYRSTGFEIEIDSYLDLEMLAPVIEQALNAVRLPAKRHPLGRVMHLPRPELVISTGSERIFGFSFGDVREHERITELLQIHYMYGIRDGRIEENLPPEVFWEYPANSIYKIYLNSNLIYEYEDLFIHLDSTENTQYLIYPFHNRNPQLHFFYVRASEDYAANTQIVFDIFAGKSFLTRCAEEIGATYLISELSRSWTFGGNTFIAEYSVDSSLFGSDMTSSGHKVYKLEKIIKNGEMVEIHDVGITLHALAELFDFRVEVDQYEPAIYFWSD